VSYPVGGVEEVLRDLGSPFGREPWSQVPLGDLGERRVFESSWLGRVRGFEAWSEKTLEGKKPKRVTAVDEGQLESIANGLVRGTRLRGR